MGRLPLPNNMQAASKYTILIVEDEELLLRAVSKKLELSGYMTVSCLTGKQALDYLDNFPELPSAIWLDYYLRDMNGLEFLEKIKKNPRFKEIPVFVISNSANPEKVNRMLALGASKYLLKAEYRLDDIIEVLGEFIENHTSSNQ